MKENTKPSEPKQVLETEKPSGRGDNMLIALEVTLQYSLMLKLHPSVALLDERLIALEKRIGHRSHTHIFDKSEVERLKNEFAAVHIEVHMLSKLSRVDRGIHFYPPSDDTSEDVTTWYSSTDMLNLMQSLYDQYWLPVSLSLQHFILSIALELRDLYQELQLAVASFFQKQREYHSGHVCNVLVYQMTGCNVWKDCMKVLEDVISLMVIAAGFMETELMQLSQTYGHGTEWIKRCEKWLGFAQFYPYPFMFHKPTFSRQMILQCLNSFHDCMMEDIMIRADDCLEYLPSDLIAKLRNALKCFGYTLMQTNANMHLLKSWVFVRPMYNRYLTLIEHFKDVSKQSTGTLDMLDDFLNQLFSAWFVQRQPTWLIDADWNDMVDRESKILTSDAIFRQELQRLRRLTMVYDASSFIETTILCTLISDRTMYQAMRDFLYLKHDFKCHEWMCGALSTNPNSAEQQIAKKVFESLLQELEEALALLQTAISIESQQRSYCLSPNHLILVILKELVNFTVPYFSDIITEYLRVKRFCSRQPLIEESMRWSVKEIDWEFILQEFAMKAKRYEIAMETRRWQGKQLNFAIEKEFHMEIPTNAKNTRFWQIYSYPLIGLYGYLDDVKQPFRLDRSESPYHSDEDGILNEQLLTAKIKLNALALSITGNLHLRLPSLLDIQRFMWCIGIAEKAKEHLNRVYTSHRECSGQTNENVVMPAIMASFFRCLLLEFQKKRAYDEERLPKNLIFGETLVEQVEAVYHTWIQERLIGNDTVLQKCQLLHWIVGVCSHTVFNEEASFNVDEFTEEDFAQQYYDNYTEESVAVWNMTKLVLLELHAEWQYLSRPKNCGQHQQRRREMQMSMGVCLPWIEKALEVAVLEFEMRDYLSKIGMSFQWRFHNEIFRYRLHWLTNMLNQMILKRRQHRNAFIASDDGFILAYEDYSRAAGGLNDSRLIAQRIQSYLSIVDSKGLIDLIACRMLQRELLGNKEKLGRIGSEVIFDIYNVVSGSGSM